MSPPESTVGARAIRNGRNDARWLVLLFVAAWCINFRCSLVGWENTLIGRFEFRQVQTALTARYFPPGGFPLDYETPVFGPPWSVPLEFPVYQATVSTVASVTGMQLDSAGRMVSWLYFQLSLPAFFLLLGSLGVRRSQRLIFLSLLVTAPLYLFYSRAFLIESTALFFCAWFLAAFARWIAGGKMRWLVVASLAGALGASVKVTTMVVFSVGALLFAAHSAWTARSPTTSARPWLKHPAVLRALVAFIIPMAGGFAWLIFSTIVRGRNENAGILNEHLGHWTFGDLTQRLSAVYWMRTIGVWTTGLIAETGLALGAYLLVRFRSPHRAVVAGAIVTFLSGQLIFSNLYSVHDYYFYGSGVFLVLGLALLLTAQYEDPSMPRWGRLGLLVVVIAMQLVNYGREYFPAQRRNEAPGELTRVIQDLTSPGQLIVVLGLDWDVTVPYYADRRALMFVAGSERDPDSIKRSIDRLDADNVGAVVIVGAQRQDAVFVDRTMSHLKLGETPLLIDQAAQVGIWIPSARFAAARDVLPLRPYATFELLASRPAGGAEHVIGQREISRRREFDRLSPRPLMAITKSDFSTSVVGSETLLNAHPPAALVFKLRKGARSVAMTFGIHDGAYTGKDHTDGVEFAVFARKSAGEEKLIYTRLLNPFAQSADQGLQSVTFEIPQPSVGELIFRTLPGPAGSYGFDWAYWGEIKILP